MAEHPRVIMEKSDDDLMLWTLSGVDNSYVHQIGETAMMMRCAVRTAEAAKATAAYTKNVADYTKNLATGTEGLTTATRNLMYATWVIAVITLLTQGALIYTMWAK